jgi:transposase-like protein
MDNKDKKKKNSKFWEEKTCDQCGKRFEALKSRNQRFCCGKCSSSFTANDKDRIEKIKKTKLERYGDSSYVNVDKAKKTCLEKYGVDNASKTKEVKDKIQKTMDEKYGGHFFTTDEFKKKTKETLGVDNVSQLDETKQKVKSTVNDRYGVDNVFQSAEVKDVIKQSNLERYGVEYPSQSTEIKSKMDSAYKKTFYNKLNTIHKLNLKVQPLFSLDEYINTDRRHNYKFKCLKCDSEFSDHIDGGHLPRCIECYPLNKGSVCEHEIVDFLKSILGDDRVSTNRRDIIDGKELDIVIEDLKLAIEYDSFYYHSFSHVGKDYHIDKTIACEEKDYRLIHIFEDEWINNQNVVKSKLKSIIGNDTEKAVYARKCEVKEIDSKLKRTFLESNHIQGSDKSKIKLGLYHEDELISVMTFSENRVALGSKSKENEYELSRFATSKRVVGAAGKLFKYFTSTYNPTKVTSYADRRFSSLDNTLYDQIGFVLDGITPVNFWYFKNGYNKRHHRFNFRKSLLKNKLNVFDSELTEYENMQMNGYDRIYDCGNLKYIWKPLL